MPAPVRAEAATVSAMSAEPKDIESLARKAPVESTTADARVVELQHELQLSRMKSDMDMLAARYEDALKRQELETRIETQALIAQAKFEAQQQLFASQQSAEAKAKAQQEANQDGLRALAERLDKPREARPIKDITSERSPPNLAYGTRVCAQQPIRCGASTCELRSADTLRVSLSFSLLCWCDSLALRPCLARSSSRRPWNGRSACRRQDPRW